MQKNMETLINEAVEKWNELWPEPFKAKRVDIFMALNELPPELQKARMDKLENKITPASLQERGFKYTPVGISGADMWQGMGIWDNIEKDIVLRGNVSTAKGGTLHLSGHFNLQVDNLEELDTLIKLFK